MGTFSFVFAVNKTYQDSATHPITLPKRHYQMLGRHLAHDHVDVTVRAEGRSVLGWIYRGTAGFGPYYQLRVSNHGFTKLPAACVNARLLSVQVRLDGESCEVQLRVAA